MKFTSHRTDEEVSLNLTPLIDVVFLLLIFFMVSTTFDTTSQLNIELPGANQPVAEAVNYPLKIQIDAKGRFFLNARELSSQQSSTLLAAVQLAIESQDQPVIIESDAESPVQSLVTALDVVDQLRLTQVAIATTRPVE